MVGLLIYLLMVVECGGEEHWGGLIVGQFELVIRLKLAVSTDSGNL